MTEKQAYAIVMMGSMESLVNALLVPVSLILLVLVMECVNQKVTSLKPTITIFIFFGIEIRQWDVSAIRDTLVLIVV